LRQISSTSLQMLLIFGVLTLVSTCFAEFHHNQFRQYTCFATVPGEPADCTLRFKEGDNERTTINDSGCFTEKDNERDQLLTYCPLQCPDAESAYVLLKRPSNNNKCVTFFSYNVVRRRNDWFLWRSGKCLSEEIQFDIGCTFPFKQIKPNPKFVKKDH
uniref:Secreted protein n=1 Tax=Parascaris univalens TaxID=6257 RepID=A0A915AUT1_PARUN